MGSALHRSFFRGMVVGGLQLSSPVTLSRNGWVATVFTGHSFEEWVGSALHRSLFRGIGVCGLQALWSLGVFRRVVRPCRPLLACPEIPADLPATPPSPTAPPGDTPPRAALAPLQAGYNRGRPPAPPCPGSPTASALLTAGPCKLARTTGTLPLLSLPPGGKTRTEWLSKWGLFGWANARRGAQWVRKKKPPFHRGRPRHSQIVGVPTFCETAPAALR